jgi:hypothetical protein
MGSAVLTLQRAILAGQPSLAELLRKTKLIAATLTLADLEHWLDQELNGYARTSDPPDYRGVFTRSLEVYNAHRGVWQFAGKLNYSFKAHQPIAQIERFSREDRVALPVSKNFSVKNDFGDSFGSDWPQQFIVAGSQYKRVVTAVVDRWTCELGDRGIKVFDIQKFMAALDQLTELQAR